MTMTTSSNDIKSVLELDINLNWTFEEVRQLMIDIGYMFGTGEPLDDDIAMFARGIIVSRLILGFCFLFNISLLHLSIQFNSIQHRHLKVGPRLQLVGGFCSI